MKISTSAAMQRMMESKDRTMGSGTANKTQKKQSATITAQFSKQMDDLYALISKDTNPHFVRCIKPNTVARPAVFESQMCMRQMRYSSLFGVCQARQLGYPERFVFDEFYANFRELAPGSTDHVSLAKSLHSMGAMKTGHFAIGHEKVFMRAELPHFLLVEWPELSKHAMLLLQCGVRKAVKRWQYKNFLGALQRLQGAVDERDLKEAEEAVRQIKRWCRAFAGHYRHQAWRSWLAAEAQMRQEAENLEVLCAAVRVRELAAIERALAELQKFNTASLLLAKKEVKEAIITRDKLVLVNRKRENLKDALGVNNLKSLLTAMEELENACMDVQFSKTTFDGWPEVKQAKVLRENLEEQERVRVLLKEALADGTLPALAAALAASEALRRRDTAEDMDSWDDLQQAQLLQRRLLQGSVKATVANTLQRIEV